MKLKLATALATIAIAATPAVANASVIERVDTTTNSLGQTTYHVTPSPEGRAMGSSGRDYDPTGDMTYFRIPRTETLKNQLICHIVFASDKPQWNLEDRRPVVSEFEYIMSTCNPN